MKNSFYIRKTFSVRLLILSICVFIPALSVKAQQKGSGNARKILSNALLTLLTDTTRATSLLNTAIVAAEAEADKRTEAESYSRLAQIMDKQNFPDSVIRYYQSAARLYNESGLHSEEAQVYHSLGEYQNDYSAFDDALKSYRRSMEADPHSDSVLHALNLIGMGTVYSRTGELVMAQENFVEALGVSERNRDSAGIGNAWNGIGIVHWKEQKTDDAMQAYEHAMKVRNAIADSAGIAATLSNMGIICRLQGKYDEALNDYHRSLGIRQRSGDLRGVGQVLFNLGSLLTDMNKNDEGFDYYQRSFVIKTLLHDGYGKLSYYLNVADLYGDMGKNADKERSLLSGIALADSLKALAFIRSFSEELANYYASTKNFENAFRYEQRYVAMNDSLASREKNAELSRLQAVYDVSEKQNRIDKLVRNQEKLEEKEARDTLFRNALIIILVIIFLFAVYVVNRTLVLRRANNTLEENRKLLEKREAEKEMLLREVHHRVKNNLQLTSSMLNLQAREMKDAGAARALKDARDRIKAMSTVHSDLLAKDAAGMVDLSVYIPDLCESILSSNAAPHDIRIEYQLDPVSIPVDDAVTIALIINEAVANSVEHAFGGMNSPQITITAKRSGNNAIITVSDNGKGIPAEYLSGGKGFGIKLLYTLGTRMGSKTEISVKDGTTVAVTLSLKS